MKPIHEPVLLESVVRVLAPQVGATYLDGTAGYGGHAAAILHAMGSEGAAVLVDRDARAIAVLNERFGATEMSREAGTEQADEYGAGGTVPRVRTLQSTILEGAQRLVEEGTRFDMILLDLGVSSPQVDQAERGFSFKADAPLDMRMDQSQARTAADVVNKTSPAELERIIREYGEEPRARAVAAAIVAARPLATTQELARVVRKSAVQTTGIDAATRTFQAIRIEVNSELEELDKVLLVLILLLVPGGRLAVISFHSLEDRIVKQFLETQSRDCICPPKQPICTCGHIAVLRKITAKPITATPDELAFNPRARSAKLRAAEKK